MPLTSLDPITALIVIDLQKGMIGYPLVHPLPQIIDRNRELLSAFRAYGADSLPVALVNVAGRPPGRTEQGPRTSQPFADGWTELLPELQQQPGDLLITKRSWGAFATTDLEAQLRKKGVTQVVVTGIATSGGVEATARQAWEQGFHVTLALDAITDVHKEAHDYSIANVFPRLGETGNTQEIISLLKNRSVHA